MEKKSVYVETSVISYLTARPPRELVAAAWQAETILWWETQRGKFDLCVSSLVLEEIGRGDSTAAAKRLEALVGVPLLEVNQEVFALADSLVQPTAIPGKAFDDALHVAVAAVYGIDYLLTWNCRHIDNAEIKPKIRMICGNCGYFCPEICTPSELMGDTDHA